MSLLLQRPDSILIVIVLCPQEESSDEVIMLSCERGRPFEQREKPTPDSFLTTPLHLKTTEAVRSLLKRTQWDTAEKADKRRGQISCYSVKVRPFHCQAECSGRDPPRPGGSAITRPFELLVRNWQASEEAYLGLMGLTSLLDNELGLKMMTLQSHHLRVKKKAQLLLMGSESI